MAHDFLADDELEAMAVRAADALALEVNVMGGLKQIHVCEAVVRRFRIEVPSGSKQGVVHHISGVVVEGRVECSCQGFHFRHKCRHLDLLEVRCGWVEGLDLQTKEQMDARECPRCGSKTYSRTTGVIDDWT